MQDRMQLQLDRMEALNVCNEWIRGKGGCWGTCGRRHPRWQDRQDLFYNQICHKYLRGRDNPPRGCHRGDRCRHMRLEKESWVSVLTNIVGKADATWDWTKEGEELDAPEAPAPQDELTRLLSTSAVVNPETVIDGMLQLVRGDGPLERYLVEVRNRIH